MGLSAVNLAPGEHKTWPVYCQFTVTGERIFSFSADDETLPYKVPVNVISGTAPKLVFGDINYQLFRKDDTLFADFSLDVANEATAGYAGNLVTFCLFPNGSNEDLRHWQVLSVAAGESERIGVRFQPLVDGQTYTLLVRCPWTEQKRLSFTVHAAEAADGVTLVRREEPEKGTYYDLQGRPVPQPYKGIYIRNGKKILIP